jgi:hypothetical protein
MINDAHPRYGPTGYGEYDTPYKITIVYSENSVFETTIAMLSDQAQLIRKSSQLSILDQLSEHPVPEALVFAPVEDAELDTLRAAGHRFIHIFMYGDAAADNEKTPDDVSRFTINDILDHVLLIPGLTPILLLEQIASSQFPNYASGYGEITNLSGTRFLRGLRHYADGANIYDIMIKMTTDYRGPEHIERHVMRGQILEEIEDREFHRSINSAIVRHIHGYTTLCVLSMLEHSKISSRVPSAVNEKQLDYVLLCTPIISDSSIEWNISAVKVNCNDDQIPHASWFLDAIGAVYTGPTHPGQCRMSSGAFLTKIVENI